mgnify:CR=1 FL=1
MNVNDLQDVELDELAKSARDFGVKFVDGYDNSITAAAVAMWLFDNPDK